MKKILYTGLLMVVSSCGIYKYEYSDSQMKVISKGNRSIDFVYIVSQSGVAYIKFQARENTHSSEFSTKDFSPGYFQCMEGCQFEFIKGEKYQIEVLPSGDRIFPPIVLQVLQDGKIIQVK